MRLLIVEDDEKLALSIKKYLETANGYAVDCLYDGESAMKRIELYKNEYDLIILDWMLPGTDGLDVLKNIREQNIMTPVLMLTAKDTVSEKTIGLNNGADDYLVKPFSPEELIARIKALLRRPQQALPAKLAFKDLTLDTASRKVTRGNKEIKLTMKEYELLEYLMRNINRVVNREQLFDHLWDFVCNSMSNVVDVHINNLRKKIKSTGKSNIIETIRGVGYTLRK
ncbi:MAG: response regulator transcription factor [Candidatus Brennerbacteria bacterium]|nr:response regulator transcription factor [Candidatus Brennerbacteria bacterium]